ncbi:MAG: hypothetical protein LQ338_007366 [Usnochroma carphineum]|nr:MAG: hypothetical protein LQ338_007366 [Usnochroma carphineum]
MSTPHIPPSPELVTESPFLNKPESCPRSRASRRTIVLACTVSKIDFGKPSVQLDGKTGLHADIILGADGLKSKCREAMLGHPDPPRLTSNLAYRTIVEAGDMVECSGLRHLAEEPAIHYWLGPQAHAVCYFLQGGRLCNIVLLCPDDLPETVHTAKADMQEMRELFRGWDPRLQILLNLVQHTTKFALLGDACHATLPYLAQGAAQAVEDGAVLGALFARIEQQSQLQHALVIYESLRKSQTMTVVKRSTRLRDIFHIPDGPQQQERDRQSMQKKPFEGYPNPWADPVS